MDNAEKLNQEREELTNQLNDYDADEVLVLFNEHDAGSLDNQMNFIIQNWTNIRSKGIKY